MEEKLIEAMKMQPALFDKGSNLFRNKYLKERAWKAVAASTGVSEEHCKSRWKSLRDRYVREAASTKTKSGANAEEKPQWCYLESMRFLAKHVAPRKTVSNFQFDDDQPSCSSSSQIALAETEEALEECVEVSFNESQSSVDTPAHKKGSKRKRVEQESHERFDRLCGSVEAVIANKNDLSPSKNSAFLQMLDECLQKKPEDVQDRLKIELLTYAYNA